MSPAFWARPADAYKAAHESLSSAEQCFPPFGRRHPCVTALPPLAKVDLPSPPTRLRQSLLLLTSVGIVLITVSGIAWRLTAHEAPSCRAMLGLRGDEPGGRRFVPRVPPYGGRPGGTPVRRFVDLESPLRFVAMLYPEFQYRPPPPSYQASMQEYRLRLLLLDRQGPTLPTPVALAAHHHHHHHAVPVVPPAVPPPSAVTTQPAPPMLSPVSPPPTYRSGMHARPPLSFPSSAEREPSRPPSYRSRTSSAAGGGILRSCVGGNASCSQDTLATVSPAEDEDQRPLHSRNPSLTLSTLSQEESSAAAGPTGATSQPADVVRRSYNTSVLGGGSLSSSNRNTPSPPPGSSSKAPDPHLLRKNHDVNTVTIVQTTDTSQVINQDTVIVSVSGHNARTLVLPSGHSEVQVTLAHV
ncbi:hypothetical protein MRX96_056980 [Rhipicephalus microplus]